jgi:transposase
MPASTFWTSFHPVAKPTRCDNTPAGIERLIATLRQRGVIRVALEAIGPYAQPLVQALMAAGFTVALVDPRRIKAFRTAEGLIAKTDRLADPPPMSRTPGV